MMLARYEPDCKRRRGMTKAMKVVGSIVVGLVAMIVFIWSVDGYGTEVFVILPIALVGGWIMLLLWLAARERKKKG
jgi:Flp pilus assembly protein TadB